MRLDHKRSSFEPKASAYCSILCLGCSRRVLSIPFGSSHLILSKELAKPHAECSIALLFFELNSNLLLQHSLHVPNTQMCKTLIIKTVLPNNSKDLKKNVQRTFALCGHASVDGNFWGTLLLCIYPAVNIVSFKVLFLSASDACGFIPLACSNNDLFVQLEKSLHVILVVNRVICNRIEPLHTSHTLSAPLLHSFIAASICL